MAFNHLPFLTTQFESCDFLKAYGHSELVGLTGKARKTCIPLHIWGCRRETSLALAPLAVHCGTHSVLGLGCTCSFTVLCGHLQCSLCVMRLWYLSQTRKW